MKQEDTTRPCSQELRLLLELIALKSQQLADMLKQGALDVGQVRARQAEITRLQMRASRF